MVGEHSTDTVSWQLVLSVSLNVWPLCSLQVMIKQMAKQRSFTNPYSPKASPKHSQKYAIITLPYTIS